MTPTKEQLEALANKCCYGTSISTNGNNLFTFNRMQLDAYFNERLKMAAGEPFGYFKAEPFGWTDCAESDDCATPLYALEIKP